MVWFLLFREIYAFLLKALKIEEKNRKKYPHDERTLPHREQRTEKAAIISKTTRSLSNGEKKNPLRERKKRRRKRHNISRVYQNTKQEEKKKEEE